MPKVPTGCPSCDQYEDRIDQAKLAVGRAETTLSHRESWRVDAVAREIYERSISESQKRVIDLERWYAEHRAAAHPSVED